MSADISNIALNKVREFNDNVVKVDMMEKLPFESAEFDLVFANLSIHYFSDENTKKLMLEIKRILKDKGIFVGSVNGLQTLEKIKDTACELEHHFYLDGYLGTNKYIRLFDKNDLKKYLDIFYILQIDERETTRFGHRKDYLVFFAQK